jgi:hypothetical protein
LANLEINENGEKVAESIKKNHLREARFFKCDISDFLKVKEACDLILKKFKKAGNQDIYMVLR